MVKNLHTGQIHRIGVTPEPGIWVGKPPRMAIYVFGTQLAVASPNANILIGNAENFRPGLAFDMNSYPIAGKFFPDFLYIYNNETWFTSCYQENESASKTYNIYKYSMDDDKFMNTDLVLHPCVNMTVSPKNQLHENFFLSRDGVLRSPACDGACDYDKKYGWLSSWYNDDSLLNYSYADSEKTKQSKQSHAIFRYNVIGRLKCTSDGRIKMHHL